MGKGVACGAGTFSWGIGPVMVSGSDILGEVAEALSVGEVLCLLTSKGQMDL